MRSKESSTSQDVDKNSVWDSKPDKSYPHLTCYLISSHDISCDIVLRSAI